MAGWTLLGQWRNKQRKYLIVHLDLHGAASTSLDQCAFLHLNELYIIKNKFYITPLQTNKRNNDCSVQEQEEEINKQGGGI